MRAVRVWHGRVRDRRAAAMTSSWIVPVWVRVRVRIGLENYRQTGL